ncbi:uncharacterized protein LOC144772707 isoform X2 [Lissotriton helveticus]
MGTPGCSTRLLFPFSRKPASCATIFRPTDRGPPLTAPSGIHALLVKGTFVSVPASESQQLCKKEERYQQIFFESEQNRSFLTCMSEVAQSAQNLAEIPWFCAQSRSFENSDS